MALVHLLAATGDEVGTLVVVGHEPVLSGAAAALAGPGSDPGALAAARLGLGTAQVAVLTLHDGWRGLAAGSCRLLAVGPRLSPGGR
jgi:phosphohistidine phosphatase